MNQKVALRRTEVSTETALDKFYLTLLPITIGCPVPIMRAKAITSFR
jgi:hypothetical protein